MYVDPTGHWSVLSSLVSSVVSTVKSFIGSLTGSKSSSSGSSSITTGRDVLNLGQGPIRYPGVTEPIKSSGSSSSSSSSSKSSSSGSSSGSSIISNIYFTALAGFMSSFISSNSSNSSVSPYVGSPVKEPVQVKQQTQEERYGQLLDSIGIKGNEGVTINGKKYTYIDLLKEEPTLKVNGWDPNAKVKLLQKIYEKMGFHMPSEKYSGIYDNWDTIAATRTLMALNGLGWAGGSGGKTSTLKGDTWDKTVISTLELFNGLDNKNKAELRGVLGDLQAAQKGKALKWEAQVEAAKKKAEQLAIIKAQKAAEQKAAQQQAALQASSLPPWGYYGAPPVGSQWYNAGKAIGAGALGTWADDSVIRPMTDKEKFLWNEHNKFEINPVTLIANSISKAATGQDLYGYYVSEGERQQAREGLIFDIGFSVFGLAEGKVLGSAASKVDDVVSKLDDIRNYKLPQGAVAGDNVGVRLSSGGSKTDFYVTSSGEVIPSTGYRYMSREASYIDELRNTMQIPSNSNGTYITFDKLDVPAPGKLQVPHDASIRASFDTLQIIDDIRVPKGKWGQADWFEPITKDFPKYGSGGTTQVITNKQITLDTLIDLLK